MSERSEDAVMLNYFHSERGDMTRYVHFDRAIARFPQIQKAKDDADYYSKVLDLMLNELDETEGNR